MYMSGMYKSDVDLFSGVWHLNHSKTKTTPSPLSSQIPMSSLPLTSLNNFLTHPIIKSIVLAIIHERDWSVKEMLGSFFPIFHTWKREKPG